MGEALPPVRLLVRAWRLRVYALASAGQLLLMSLGGGTFRVPGRAVDERLVPFASIGFAFGFVVSADILVRSTPELRHPRSGLRRLMAVSICVCLGALWSIAGFASVDVLQQWRNLLLFTGVPLLFGDRRLGEGLMAVVVLSAVSWILGSGGVLAPPKSWALPLLEGASMLHLALVLIIFQAGLIRFVASPRRQP